MKKNSIRNNKGITLMAEVITVLLLIIIISIISYSSMNSLKVKKLNNMYSDITAIQEKAANYYMKYGKAPVITTEKVDDEDVLASIEDEKNPNDDPDGYYKVDISLLDNISLNNKPNEDGYYFMNIKTLTTYYSKGVSIDKLKKNDENENSSKTYHTVPQEYDNLSQLAVNKEDSINPTLSDTTATYDGQPHEIGVSGGSGGKIKYKTSTDKSIWNDWTEEGIPSLTDAGILYVRAYVEGNSKYNSTKLTEVRTITVNKVVLEIPTQNGKITYDGTQKTPSWNNYNNEKMIIAGSTTGIEAGDYETTFTLRDTSNYEWIDNTTVAKTVIWTIFELFGQGPWIQNGTTVTSDNGEGITLNVGSSVKGYSVTVDGNTFGDGKWCVLGAKNGKLLITTNKNVKSLNLKGADGYVNGISKLNNVASKYTNSNFTDTNTYARSINADDIVGKLTTKGKESYRDYYGLQTFGAYVQYKKSGGYVNVFLSGWNNNNTKSTRLSGI